PAMALSMHEDPVTLNLAITAYLLSSAVFLPISGWVADRFGATVVFCAAMVLFAFSSLLCGLSQNLGELIGARMLQGMAGAMMAPVGRLVLLRSVPKSDLVRAMSYLTMPALLGPVLGPPLGGFIVTHVSWRWIFYINIPVCVVGVTLVVLFIRNIKEEVSEALDWPGFVLTGFGLAGVVYGFEILGPGSNLLPIGLIVAGAAFLLIYRWHARRIANPLLDLSVFRLQSFIASNVGGAFLRMAMGATPFLLAMLLQMGFGLSALAAGLMTFTSAAGALVMKFTARPIINQFGFKRVLVASSVITGTTFMSYSLFQADTPHILIIAALLAGGFFRSLQFTAMLALSYAEVPQEKMSGASSMASVAQQLSQSFGIGVAAMLLGALRSAHHSPVLTAADVSPTFLVIGAMTLLGLFFFVPLPAGIGEEIRGARFMTRRSGAPESRRTFAVEEEG
ncbi:MAG: MFS transporter, partial [Caulobacteraceae bacterium]|nr:MFS transporter [Caulobacteraceae bacterium]